MVDVKHGPSVTICKIKRPVGAFWFDLDLLDEDGDGVWLYGPIGSRWTAPGDDGGLTVAVVVLLAPDRPWVRWWVDDPTDRRLEIDVCLPPERTEQGWTYVDLELDPVRHEPAGRVEIEDWDEYEQSLRDGWMNASEADIARSSAEKLARALRCWDQPWQHRGWSLLSALTHQP